MCYKVIIIILIALCSIVLFAQTKPKTIHVFVALCDNQNQGIVPVSKTLGNGQDPKNNLYWGAMYGIKTFLKNSHHWTLEKAFLNPEKSILERVIFKHKSKDCFLIADAYDGAAIKQTTQDFLDAISATNKEILIQNNSLLPIKGAANLVVYIGHNGLMDFNLKEKDLPAIKAADQNKQCIILCCKSKQYFETKLKNRKANPLLLTTNFMAPEAYTLDAAVSSWLNQESSEQIREQAAQAYSKYQKCSIKAARKLFDISK